MALLIAAVLVVGCLIVLGSMASFVVDWFWFSAIGYWHVFWAITVAIPSSRLTALNKQQLTCSQYFVG